MAIKRLSNRLVNIAYQYNKANFFGYRMDHNAFLLGEPNKTILQLQFHIEALNTTQADQLFIHGILPIV